MKLQTTIYPLDEAYEVTIEVEYDASYEPARGMGGPWEDSSPADSTLEIVDWTILSSERLVAPEDTVPLTDDAILKEVEAKMDSLEEACWENFMREYDHGD